MKKGLTFLCMTLAVAATAAGSASSGSPGPVVAFAPLVAADVTDSAGLRKRGEPDESGLSIVHRAGAKSRVHKRRAHRRARSGAVTSASSTNRNATVTLNPQPLPPARVPTTGINRNAKTKQ